VAYRAATIGYGRLTNPQLSIVLGLTTLVIGSTLGVIVQILYATNNLNEQNGVLIGAHASAQVGGYLILVAAGLAEWILNPGGRRTRGGEIQSWLLFLAGLTLATGRPRSGSTMGRADRGPPCRDHDPLHGPRAGPHGRRRGPHPALPGA